MSIKRYKSFEEAEKALWNYSPDHNYYSKIITLWNFADQLSPGTCIKGIVKFKSIEEANKHREELELAAAKKHLLK